MKQDFRENLGLAIDTLRTHKMRSLLTVLGVVIGVGVIVLVAALLTGFRETIREEITSWGADTAWVDRFSQGPHIGRTPKEERLRKPLSLEDGLAIQEFCPSVHRIAISLFDWEHSHDVRYKAQVVQGGDFRGTFPAFILVYGNAALKAGRFFTDTENVHHENVVVIGQNIAEALFPRAEDAVNQEILVDGTSFMVIGVLEKPSGGFGGNDEDRRVVIPYYTFHKIYPSAFEHGYRIQGYPGRLDEAVDEAREVLRRRRNVGYNQPDNFSITTQLEQVEQFNAIIGGTVLALVILSSIGLLIGGVGVMNIMLVSVTERTREIGVRKAIGAKRSDIVWQFLFEAMTLTGAGGVIGVIVSAGLALLIPYVTTMKAFVPLWAVVTGLVVSIGVGLIFGVWPAVKAARLDPVEALRYE
jgi:ABC-type antimicrobial peptide transport system permease subunit